MRLMKNRTRLGLEQLEDRCTPSLTTLSLDGGGNLSIVGSPNNAGGILNINQTAANTIQVIDAGFVNSTFLVPGNISVTSQGSPVAVIINFDAGGFTFNGSVKITTDNQAHSVFVGGTAGVVSGNFTVTTGNSADTVNFNVATDIDGTVSIDTKAGSDASNLNIAGIDIGGNLMLNNVNTWSASTGDTVGGSIYYNSSTEGINNSFNTSAMSVAGGITYTGGPAGDAVTLAATVIGSATVSAGNGTNSLSQSAGATSDIRGNLTYVGGNGNDAVTLNGTVRGNVNVYVGDGTTNSFTISATGVVLGTSINYTGGNGADTLTFAGTATGARLTANLSNGTDTVNLNSNALGSGSIDFGLGADVFVSTVIINFPWSTRNL